LTEVRDQHQKPGVEEKVETDGELLGVVDRWKIED